MDAIVSLLDPQHTALVETIWAELQREFGLRGIYARRSPHFSYHLADHYDLKRLIPHLRAFAHDHAPFEVTATGLGVFTGSQPVLYIPVVRAPQLHALHAALCDVAAQSADGVNPVYGPDTWMPHITLAYGDIRPDALPDMIRLLAQREFSWRITIDHLLLMINAGDADEKRFTFPFKPSV